MNFKIVLIALLSLTILISSFKISGAEESISTVIVETDLPSLQKLDECIQRLPILDELVREQGATIVELKSSLSNKDELIALEKRENEINMKILELKNQEIAALTRNFDQMKEVADRAIKLAETAKPKSNWFLAILVAAAGIAGALIAH